MAYFADFKFELEREVRKPDVFCRADPAIVMISATLAANVYLREKGYTTRLVVVFMPDTVHVVCYVAETKSYLDYNCRKNSSPLVKCDGNLSAIARQYRSLLPVALAIRLGIHRSGRWTPTFRNDGISLIARAAPLGH